MPEAPTPQPARFSANNARTAEQANLVNHFAAQYSNVADAIDRSLPNGRAKSIAITQLEDSFAWLKTAIEQTVA